jgi:hypothetical protein
VATGGIIQLLALDVDAMGQGTLRGLVGEDMDGDPSDNPLIADGLTAVVARDCPSGPDSCVEDSPGETLTLFLDLDQDGVITAGELRDSFLFQGALNGDLDLLDADGAPGPDGVFESMSWGMGFATAGAAFDPP